jgi:hypothetical protein
LLARGFCCSDEFGDGQEESHKAGGEERWRYCGFSVAQEIGEGREVARQGEFEACEGAGGADAGAD